MTKLQLLVAYPKAERFINRMCLVDEHYGSQRHQRMFVQRLHSMQYLAPCATDHEHNHDCYAKDVLDRVCREQMARGEP